MAVGNIPKKGTKKSAKTTRKKVTGFTDEEKSAMQQRVTELQTAAKRGAGGKEPGAEQEVLQKIAAMNAADRAKAERIHSIIKASAPTLTPKLWYGMPAYYRDGKNICFFQPAQKFKTRYATFGFNDPARLDEGHVWPVAFAITELTAADEAKIASIVKKAVS
jgi:uncharacterized protein YdhG (YjbR/CyaY superfamily)